LLTKTKEFRMLISEYANGGTAISNQSFGQVIAKARKARKLTQRDLAATIRQEDGKSGISPAYLNDIEHDRRKPTDEHLIREFARRLRLDANHLLLLASRQLPEEYARAARAADPERYNEALVAFRQKLSER
jgi:transcriptional regulator with XRE-family HTH domain